MFLWTVLFVGRTLGVLCTVSCTMMTMLGRTFEGRVRGMVFYDIGLFTVIRGMCIT